MKLGVLMYHDVYRDAFDESGFQSLGANHYKISEALFKEHLEALSGLALSWTFDDGGVSVFNIIAPLLEKYGLRGHFFIVTNCIGLEGFLSKEQILELYNRGHIIGSHSSSHPEIFIKLTTEEKKKEWLESIRCLSSIIGSEITEVSIPNGYFEKKDLNLFRDLGIMKVYTSSLVDNYKDNTLQVIGRISIDASFTSSRILRLLSGGWCFMVSVIRQKVLSFLKGLLGNYYLIVKAFIRKMFS